MNKSLLALQKSLHSEINAARLRIVLASSSPRRREALAAMLGGEEYFDIVVSAFEELLPHSDFASAIDYCLATARGKAIDVCAKLAQEQRKTLVIAADTVVALHDHILEKPASTVDATRMLRMLSGTEHAIHTCVLVYELPTAKEAFAFTTTTLIKFAQLTDEDIAAYIATGEAMDKAGAYAIQGTGRLLVESIDGNFFNAVGFPAREFALPFANMLEEILSLN